MFSKINNCYFVICIVNKVKLQMLMKKKLKLVTFSK